MDKPARRRATALTLIDAAGVERHEIRIVYTYPGLTANGRRRVIFINGDPVPVEFDGTRAIAHVRQLPYLRRKRYDHEF